MSVDLQAGAVLVCRSSGRLMQLVEIERSGALRLTVARSDPGARIWRRWNREVVWPREWVWLPGEQMEFPAIGVVRE